MKKSLFTKPRAKPRPKKPMAPPIAEPIEPVNAPLYPPVGDLYPHLQPDPFPVAPTSKPTVAVGMLGMPSVTKWPAGT